MSEYTDLVLGAYLGEVAGEAAFAGFAMQLADDPRQAKVEVLRLLEARTEALARPLAEAHGLTAAAVVEARRRGWGHARAGADHDARWAMVVHGMAAVCPGEIEKFRRWCALAPEADAHVAGAVLAHEEALLEFATREADGAPDGSLAPVLALLDGWYLAEADATLGIE